MTSALAAPHEAPSLAPEREVELLRGVLDEVLLAELGWDARAMVVRAVLGHSSFGYRVCVVPGCELPGTYRGTVCTTCYQRFTKSVAAGRFGGDLEEFKRIPREPAGRLAERLCTVCCVLPDRVRVARSNGLCSAHDARRKYLGLTIEEFLARDDIRPYPTFGVCRREGCERWADNRRGLCRQCEKVWRYRGCPELAEFYPDPYTVVEELRMLAPISLAGLPEQLRLELLFIAQQFSLQKRKRSREAWRGLVRDARAARVSSLLELERKPATTRTTGQVLVVRKLAQRELEVLYADPEIEFAADVWDLRKVGLAAGRNHCVLDFSVIGQDWLREAAKRWARFRASYTQGPSLQGVLLAVSLLSESLALRDDGGHQKPALARADVRAFVERLGRLHRAGRLPDTTYYRSAGKVRQFLRECRDFGLYQPGEPLHGLSAEFAVWLQDLVREPNKHADAEGRALPQVVIDQLLSEPSLKRLGERYGEGMVVMVRILAETGRRPDELAKLSASCLDRSEFIDQQTGELEAGWVLVHDMPKVGIKDFRLAINESTAQLIIEQRERVVARYPGRPLSQLRLFPREKLNPDGTEPNYSARLSSIVRGWVSSLPELVGPSGEQFPRERVFPYAFRHSFAQRHADNGTPIDVLATMMGHRTIDTTRGYYKVNKARMRKAVATVSEMQLNHRGHHVSADLAELVDAEYERYQVGQIAVAFGTCHEPSNVKASGQSCPYRFRCFGCTHFRTDPSYLPELREHLQRLLVDHERLNIATDGMLEDWARRDALPAPEEIVAVRRLIRAAETILDGLTSEERASVDELFDVIRRARANIDTALPIHLSAAVRQPAPTLYPQPAARAAPGS